MTEKRLTRVEFQSSENLMSQLDEVLRFPVLVLALDIVRREKTANGLPSPIPGVDYGAQVAAEGAKSIGCAETIEALYSLARPPKIRQQNAVDQQGVYVSGAIKRVAASQQYSEQELQEALKQ